MPQPMVVNEGILGLFPMMLMPASAEFSSLCQSQISTVARSVGADSTAVYLAESWNEQALPKLVPIAVYPVPEKGETLPFREEPARMPSETGRTRTYSLQTSTMPSEPISGEQTIRGSKPNSNEPSLPSPPDQTLDSSQAPVQQLAIPLVHEGGVIGILVGWRADHPWQSAERRMMEECAQALALACVLDQRGQWLQDQLSTLNRLQTQQSDRFHELLHQLRNPLTTVKTFGKLLLKRLGSDNSHQSLVQNMLRESDRMQHILGYFDDTLQAADQSRTGAAQEIPLLAPPDDPSDEVLETPALPATSEPLSHFGGSLTIEPCSIADLVNPLIDSIRTLADASDREFHVLSPEQPVIVKADARALMEVISICLENALKYTPADSHIWLQWGMEHPQDNGYAEILIGDSGPGIPAQDQPYLFQRHYRGIQGAGTISGSGLGLAIAQDLVQEMHGEIVVYSPLSEIPSPLTKGLPEAVTAAVGTAFVIWLPKTP